MNSQVERLYLADGMKLAPSFVVHEANLPAKNTACGNASSLCWDSIIPKC